MSRIPLEDMVPQPSLLECKPVEGTRYYVRYLIWKHVCPECNEHVWFGADDDTGKHNCPGLAL